MLLEQADTLTAANWYSELGVEPLSTEFSGQKLFELSRGRKADVKSLLTDQGNVAGIGNAYVCEALWEAKIRPVRPAGSLTATEANQIVRGIKAVLSSAIKIGESSIASGSMTSGRDGYFEYTYKVYDKEGAACPRHDGGMIERTMEKGRSTFFCRSCQQ